MSMTIMSTEPGRRRLAVLSTLLFLALSACASVQKPAGDDRARITAIEDRIRAAFAAGNAEGVAAEYTEDALLLPQGAPAVSGRAAIADLYRTVFKDYRCELETEIEEVEIAGDWAFVRGRLQSTVTPKAGGDPMVSHGKYLAIVRRGPGGVWRFARDIYNMDHPPGQP
jgi:uncharacterized protein (TIGR02246 family)